MQGPERFLADMGATFSCAVDGGAPALLDPAHRAFIGHEVYYVSSDEALRAFVAEPWRYTGKVTDPVSLARFQPGDASPRRSFGGRLFFFETAEHAATFDSDPAPYGTPKPAMQMK